MALNDNHVGGGAEVETGLRATQSTLHATGGPLPARSRGPLGRHIDWITRYDTDDRARMGILTPWIVAAEGVLR
jgi:hypothetical protein